MRTYKLTIQNKTVEVEVLASTATHSTLRVNGREVEVELEELHKTAPTPAASGRVATRAPAASAASAPKPAATPAPAPPPSGGGSPLTAPIPGSIMEVYVREGDTVEAGQIVVKMEAMKMENEIKAKAAGTVQTVYVQAGNSVAQGASLVLIT